jgi:hypothetical protein
VIQNRCYSVNIWEHRLGNAAEFVDEISGGRNKLVTVLKNLSSGKPDTGQLSNIYIWKGTNEVLVESDAPVKRLFPYITVTSFSNNDVFKRIDELYTLVLCIKINSSKKFFYPVVNRIVTS